jgi:hypothetical protein
MADDYVIQMVTDSMKELVQLEDGQLAWRVTLRTYTKGEDRLSTPQTEVYYVPVADDLLPDWVMNAVLSSQNGIPLVSGAGSARSQPQRAPGDATAAIQRAIDSFTRARAARLAHPDLHRRQMEAEQARIYQIGGIQRRRAELEGPLAPKWGEMREMGLEILTTATANVLEKQQLAFEEHLLGLPGVDWGSLLPRVTTARSEHEGGVDKSSEIEER